MAGNVTRTYATDEAGRIVQVCDPDCASGTVYLVTWNGHGDATGLWRQNADGTLTLANSYAYSSWGTPTTTVASGFSDLGFRFLYVGASDVQWDDAFGLGLLYMHARTYSPAFGRFLQPDPARAEDNLYQYARNSPVTSADPSGAYWYRIKPGDTLQSISRRFWGNTRHVQAIIRLNQRLRLLPSRRISLHAGHCLDIPILLRHSYGDLSCPTPHIVIVVRRNACPASAFALGGWTSFAGSIEGAFEIAQVLGLSFPPSEVPITAIHVVLGGGMVVFITLTAVNCSGR